MKNSELSDRDWAFDQVLNAVHQRRGCNGAYEHFLFEQLVRQDGQDRPSWQARTTGQRAAIVSDVIQYLLDGRRIHTVTKESRGIGRRCFRITNILDTIASFL